MQFCAVGDIDDDDGGDDDGDDDDNDNQDCKIFLCYYLLLLTVLILVDQYDAVLECGSDADWNANDDPNCNGEINDMQLGMFHTLCWRHSCW